MKKPVTRVGLKKTPVTRVGLLKTTVTNVGLMKTPVIRVWLKETPITRVGGKKTVNTTPEPHDNPPLVAERGDVGYEICENVEEMDIKEELLRGV